MTIHANGGRFLLFCLAFLVLAFAALVLLILVSGVPGAQASPGVIATVPVGAGARGLDVNPNTNRIYVANSSDDDVSVIDGATNSVIATVPVGNDPLGVGVNPITNRIYVSNYNSGDVSVIDGATNSVIATVPVGNDPVPGNSGPLGVGVNPITNRIYVSNFQSNNVSVIDGATNSVIHTVPVVRLGPSGVDVNPITNRIYVANSSDDDVSVIDGATDTHIAAGVPVGSGPEDVGVNAATNRVYVTNDNSASVSVIDGATNAVVATVPVGNNPRGVGVNPITNRVYVANWNGSTISVIDGATNSVVATVPLPLGGLFDVGVNPNTNLVYVADVLGNVRVIGEVGATPTPTPTTTPIATPTATPESCGPMVLALGLSLAAPTCAPVVGKVVEVVGSVTVIRADGSHVAATLNLPVYEGDVIETSHDGAVALLFADNTTFAISEGARMSVDQFLYNAAEQSGTGFFSLLQGLFLYVSGLIGKNDPGNINIETPVGSVGIRGTEFIADVTPDSLRVDLIHGAVNFTPDSGVTSPTFYAPQTLVFDDGGLTSADPLSDEAYAALKTQAFPPVGGVVEQPVLSVRASDASGDQRVAYEIAVSAALLIAVLAVSAWYARRRWFG